MALAVLAALGMPAQGQAAACCMSAAAWGSGRLLAWESAALGSELSFGSALGRWDASGRWSSLDAEHGEREGRAILWGMARLGPEVSAHLRLPVVAFWRRAGSLHESGGGLGDLDAGVRWQLLGIGEVLELPALALTLGVVAPSGTPVEESAGTLEAGATGRGAWALGLAVELEKTRMPWYLRLNLGVTVPLPRRVDALEVDQRHGPALTAVLSGGRQLVEGLVLSAIVTATLEADGALDGAAVADSGAAEGSAALALSLKISDDLTLQSRVESALPWPRLGANRTGLWRAAAGLRWGYTP